MDGSMIISHHMIYEIINYLSLYNIRTLSYICTTIRKFMVNHKLINFILRKEYANKYITSSEFRNYINNNGSIEELYSENIFIDTWNELKNNVCYIKYIYLYIANIEDISIFNN